MQKYISFGFSGQLLSEGERRIENMTFLVKNEYYNILLFHRREKRRGNLEILKCGKTELPSLSLHS